MTTFQAIKRQDDNCQNKNAMDKKAIYNCKKQLIQNNLGDALKAISELKNNHDYSSLHERISKIQDDYHLMLSYYRNGFPDPSRDCLYNSLLRKLDRIANDAALIQRLILYPSKPDFINNAADEIQPKEITFALESFVSDTALLSLDDNSASEKGNAIYKQHHEFMSKLFNHISFSRQWHKEDMSFYENLVVSPTVDNRDAALIVSAITLAVITHFDIYKYLALAHIYQRTTEMVVRQRAIVGWAMTTTRTHSLYPEVKDVVTEMLSNKDTAHLLLELQTQIYFCMNAEKDNAEITRDIMPNLMKNKGFDITRNGIIEKEDDAMQDILDPESSDRAMEELERSFQRMAEMQRNGSDIYFGGFKQMKRYPFFYTLSNWFCPFYQEHPGLSNTTSKLKNSKFLDILQKNGPFCDSDKFSFALALATVVDKIPENMRSALNESDATFGPMANDELIHSEANVRLMYLQDLYRFFRLSDYKNYFYNPFGGEDGRNALFFAYDIYEGAFQDSDVQKIGYFLLKRNQAKALELLLKHNPPHGDVLKHDILCALCKMGNGQYDEAYSLLDKVLQQDPDNRRCLNAYARLSLLLEHYEDAETSYRRLTEMIPENKTYTLNLCISLIKNSKAQEALNMLYKLNYESPDDLDVTRVLAWCLMACKKIPQAEKEYNTILNSQSITADDYLNAGYCHWISGNMEKAISYMQQYKSMQKDETKLHEEIKRDQDILLSNGIRPSEIHMMNDLI